MKQNRTQKKVNKTKQKIDNITARVFIIPQGNVLQDTMGTCCPVTRSFN